MSLHESDSMGVHVGIEAGEQVLLDDIAHRLGAEWECSICLESGGGAGARAATQCCLQTLHIECAYKVQKTCPMCRRDWP
jgi:hypothetical protein